MRRSGWLSGTVAVLVTVGGCTADGGRAVGRGAERPAPTLTTAGAAGFAVGSVRTLAGMTVPRATHTATLLRDGTVLVAGGFGRGNGAELATTERYSPATGRFAPGPRMTTPRMGHSATLLPDGRVLLAGGFGAGGTATPACTTVPSSTTPRPAGSSRPGTCATPVTSCAAPRCCWATAASWSPAVPVTRRSTSPVAAASRRWRARSGERRCSPQPSCCPAAACCFAAATR